MQPSRTAFSLGSTRAPYQPLVCVLLACCSGILIDRFVAFPFGLSLGVAFVSLGLWLCFRVMVGHALAVLCLLLAVAATSSAWHHLSWHLFERDELGLSAGGQTVPICLEGSMVSGPKFWPAPADDPLRTVPAQDQSSVTIDAIRLRDGYAWKEVSGRVTVLARGNVRGVRAGDRLRVYGLLATPGRPLNPGEFDFASDMRRRGELSRIACDAAECIQVVESASLRQPTYWLHKVRAGGDRLLWKYLRHDQAGLASAVLLGLREQVAADQMEDFMTTGTVHLLAISGLHVGILAAGFWFLARWGWLPRRTTLWMAIGLVVFYALLTDARPPVVRAAVLISVICVARLLGRRAFDFNSLALAGLIVLIMNPSHLFQTGTQLSFLAVATLACSQRLSLAWVPPEDPLQRLIRLSRPWPIRVARQMGSFLSRLWLASTVIWLVALPLVMYRFHLVSPIAVLLNPIVWFPMGVALFSGFGVLLFGWLCPPLAKVSGWLCDQSLSAIEACIHFGLRIPFGYAWVPSPPTWWVVGFYGALAIAVSMPGLRPSRRACLALGTLWMALGFAVTVGPAARVGRHKAGEMVCTFTAVGHGTSALVELPDGRTLLYDAGRLGTPQSGVRTISSLLWSRGLMHLDAVVISHADADHYNALPGLLQRFSVGVVYVSPVMFREDSDALTALRGAIVSRGIPLRELDSRHQLATAAPVELEILHPLPRGVLGGDNANSIVLRVAYAGRTLLLPGDLESPGLEDVMAETPLDCSIVMAPHHGSIRSNPRGFSAWSTPEYVAISGGYDEDLPVVRWAYEQNSAQVFHTQTDGAIQTTISPRGVQVACWDGSRWRLP